MTKHNPANGGYALIVIMFLLALSIPATLSGGYLKNASMMKNLSNQIRDTHLYWATNSLTDVALYNLKNDIQQYTLGDARFCPTAAGSTCPPVYDITHATTWLGEITDRFKNFVTQNNPNSPNAYLASAFDEAEAVNFMTRVDENPAPATGVAKFTIAAETKLGDIYSNIRSGSTKILRIRVSNVSSFSIFVAPGKDFSVSPGTNTNYDGPIYAGKNVYLAPHKGTELKFSCPSCELDDPKIEDYALHASGNIFWNGAVAIGAEPPNFNLPPPPQQTASQLGANKLYEIDVLGKPVRYRFLSNVDPAWKDNDSPPNGLQAGEMNIIKVQDNRVADVNGVPYYTSLIDGVNNPRRSPPVYYDFLRLQSDPLIPPSTSYTPVASVMTPAQAGASVVMHSSLIYDPNNPATAQPYTPFLSANTAWDSYINSNFKIAQGADSFYMLQSGAPSMTLQIGSNDAYDLIDLSKQACDPPNVTTNCDNDTLQHVKFQWTADGSKRFDNGTSATINGTSDTTGIALDFRKWNCIGNPSPAPECSNNNIKGVDPKPWTDPGNGFLRIVTDVTQPPLNRIYYQDARRVVGAGGLFIIELDVSKLQNLISSSTTLDSAHPFSNEPMVLYIGLPYPPSSVPYHTLNTVIRIVKGTSLPSAGLTIATNGFVQVQGDYNINGIPPSYSGYGGGPGGQCEMVPAAIAADQIMLLSNAWQDWQGHVFTVLSPSPSPPNQSGYSFAAPTDPTSPGGTGTFQIHDYRSHPVRPNSPGASADVTVNAILLGGDVPNQLTIMPAPTVTPTPTNNPDYELGLVSREFYDYNLTWYSSGQIPFVGGTRKPYLKFGEIGFSIDSTANPCPFPDGPFNDSDDPNGYCATNGTGGRSNNPLNAHVEIIDFWGSSSVTCTDDQPCLIDLGVIGDINSGVRQGCTSCIGDAANPFNIPLYIKVDENGKYLAPCNITASGPYQCKAYRCTDSSCTAYSGAINPSDITSLVVNTPLENAHLKRNISDSDSDVVFSVSTAYTQIKPGTRFAALARYRSDPNPAAPGSVRPLLGYNTTYASGVCCDAAGVPSGYTCQTYQTQCSCPTCPGSQCSGEGCAGVTPTCQQTCTTWICPAGTNNSNCPTTNVYPSPYATVRYSKGGVYKSAYTNSTPNSYTLSVKDKYLYLPAYISRFNGGFENIFRVGEDWRKWNCNFSANPVTCTPISGQVNQLNLFGSQHNLWYSKTLVRSTLLSTGPTAYWSNKTYTPPLREFKYAVTLRYNECVPPAMPQARPQTEDVSNRRF